MRDSGHTWSICEILSAEDLVKVATKKREKATRMKFNLNMRFCFFGSTGGYFKYEYFQYSEY